MKNTPPQFTIITATYNAEKYLEESIKSVCDQDHSSYEYIIVDADSSDGTKEIIERYRDSIDVYISEADNGIYDAWNKGLKSAKGDWILFIGSDDVLVPDALSSYAKFILEENLETSMVISSKNMLISDSGNDIREWGRAFIWTEFKWNFRIAHVGALHSKNIFNKYGNFDTSYKIAGDYEFLLRAGDQMRASFMDKITVKMRVVGVSNSDKLSYREAIRAKKTTGNRNVLLCYLDALYIFTVVSIRKILNK